MKQTVLQELRQDLVDTKLSAKQALENIQNEEKRNACQEVVRLTLNNIIKRIDEELLELEKEQAQNYAEFAIRCDRKKLPILEFDGFIKL